MPETATPGLSDKAIAVFAFAAYHQLESGQSVRSVVRDDGHGHGADEDAVTELSRERLAAPDGNEIAFTSGGLDVLARMVEALRDAARS